MLSYALQTPQVQYFSRPIDNSSTHQCKLQWRQGQLVVKSCQDYQQSYLPSLDSQHQLVVCLKHSPVRLVCIDPSLGEEVLQRWADACSQAKKPLFLQGTVSKKMSKHSNFFGWRVNRLIDRVAALLLLVGLSPIMLAIFIGMSVYSRRPIFSYSWRIGLRGKFIRMIKFHTLPSKEHSPLSKLDYWLCKYRLDEIPQLFNVLRGDIALIGASPLTISEAVQFNQTELEQSTNLPWAQTDSTVVVKL